MTREVDFFAGLAPKVPSLWDVNGEGYDYAEKAYRGWLETAGRMQSDAMEFVRNRLEKDAAAVADLGKCRTAVEAFNVQFAYARDAFADFVGEGRRIATLLGDVTREAMPYGSGAERPAEVKKTTRRGGTHAAH